MGSQFASPPGPARPVAAIGTGHGYRARRPAGPAVSGPGGQRARRRTDLIASGRAPTTSAAPIGASAYPALGSSGFVMSQPPLDGSTAGAGRVPAPAAASRAASPCRYAAAAAASPTSRPGASSARASPDSTSPVPAVASHEVPVELTHTGGRPSWLAPSRLASSWP